MGTWRQAAALSLPSISRGLDSKTPAVDLLIYKYMQLIHLNIARKLKVETWLSLMTQKICHKYRVNNEVILALFLPLSRLSPPTLNLRFPGALLLLHPGVLLVEGHHGEGGHPGHPGHPQPLQPVAPVPWHTEIVKYLDKKMNKKREFYLSKFYNVCSLFFSLWMKLCNVFSSSIFSTA